MRTWILALVVVTLLTFPHAVEAKTVVINSADWKDVYSGMLFASLKGYDSIFLTSEYAGDDVINRIKRIDPTVILVESENVPYIPSFEKDLEREEFTVQKILSTSEKPANIILAEDIATSSFIVVGPAYGYDAISVAPYALLTKSYVVFADKNTEEAIKLMRRKGTPKILIYGYIEPEYGILFNEFGPDMINEGDKYFDNVKIVERFLEIKPTTQAHLTTGDFIESSLFVPDYPTIFLGVDLIPERTRQLIEDKITVGVIIGNELFNVASGLKDDLRGKKQFSVIVKFARGSGSGGTFSEVKSLDMFFMPRPATNMSVESVKYNLFTHQLEVTYRNNEDLPTYFKSVITIFSDGERKRTLGDEDIKLLPPGGTVGVGYDIDLTELLDSRMVMDVRIFTQFGTGVVSLTNVYEETFRDIEVFSAGDSSQGRINSVIYDPLAEAFEISLENVGDKTFYYRIELSFKENGADRQAFTADVYSLPGKTAGKALIPYQMPDGAVIKDLRAVLFYGDRENFLVNKFEKDFEFTVTSGFGWLWVVLILVIILLVLYIIYRRVSNW